MNSIKNILYLLILNCLIVSCGGDDSTSPAPTPEPVNKAPTTPLQVYPVDNELCIDNVVNFQWKAAEDPENDVISYVVDVAKTSAFTTIIATKTVATTSADISLEKGVAYYWRITAKDSKGLSSASSSANGFYTEGEGDSNYAPFLPQLVAPAFGGVLQSPTTANLQWTASDVDNDVLTYDVYFDTVNPPVTIVGSNQSTNSFTTETLTASTSYFWKIIVKDSKGGQTIGQVWNFKTD